MDILNYWPAFVIIALAIATLISRGRIFGIVRVPTNQIGLVKKKFTLGKHILPKDRIVALNGEAGWQADTLSPDMYFWYWPWQYTIELIPFTVIKSGMIGVVLARDGDSMPEDRIVARKVECNNFQDARKFLAPNAGQKGKQSAVLLAGSYKINTLLFEIATADVVVIPADSVGIVTTADGKPLPKGEIAGAPVDGHNNYQDFDKFIQAGGYRGLQQPPLLAGSWNINPWAVSIQIAKMVVIPIGYVGVVNSFVGDEGVDLSGKEFEHGNIVSKGQKGVWNEAFGPGKYAINQLTMAVEIVPTTNIVLNWATGKTEAHELDKGLSTITVRSKDGFTFNLDVSQIIHVPAPEAPKVIARFGSMKNLISQVLEPTIGNYFRNSAQNDDVIAFLTERKERQENAKRHIDGVLAQYNVKAVDTLIGDITPPPTLMETLTNRKLAQENKITFESQRLAQKERQEFEKEKAIAEMQVEIVKANQGIVIAENQASAVIKQAEGAAKAVQLNAHAEAERIEVTGKAEASKVEAIGAANAKAYEAQAKAITPDNLTKMTIVDKIASGKVKIMPDTLITGGGKDGSPNIVESMMAMLFLQNGAPKK